MTWKNPEQWEAMKGGKDCPMCSDIYLPENQHSFLIKEMKYSFVRLPKNQYFPGWVVVFSKRHANELFELTDEENAGFAKKTAQVAKAVNIVFKPVKIDYAIYGNLCPHLHYHLFPQKFENDPHAPIKQDAAEVFLSDKEYRDIILKLQAALEKIG